MHNPLAQFTVKPLVEISILGHNVSFTNSSLFMVVSVLISVMFLWYASCKKSLVPSRMQLVAEELYKLINNMLHDNVGEKGKAFLPLIFSIFIFILFCNLLGLLPYSFTPTSHIIVTFAIAMLIFLTITLVGFIKHGLHFFSLFAPRGTPWWLLPLMVVIEMFTYLARPISLSLRLAANMTAGHILLKVIAGFVVMLTVILKPLPMPIIVVLIGFEFFVALLQAYIFTILSCVYLNDAVNLH